MTDTTNTKNAENNAAEEKRQYTKKGIDQILSEIDANIAKHENKIVELKAKREAAIEAERKRIEYEKKKRAQELVNNALSQMTPEEIMEKLGIKAG